MSEAPDEAPGPIVVEAPVEIDPTTVGVFTERLEAAPPTAVVHVDCSQVEFIDSSGLRALVLAVNRQEAAGGHLRVQHPTRVVRRLLEIADLTSLIV